MIKIWLIKVSPPVCGTDTYYRAYSEDNPELLKDWDKIFDGIIEELWDDYSWTLHLDDDEYDSEEEEQEVYDQAYEDWRCDCGYVIEEATEEDLRFHAPAGDINAIEIVYDERK